MRLEPPYILVMCLSFIALQVVGYRPEQAPTFGSQNTSLVESFLASLLYMHGLVFNAPPRLNPPAWSLEIEIQFYLLAPFLVVWFVSRRNWIFLSSAVLGCVAISALLDELLGVHGIHNRTIFGHAYGFMLGVAVCRYAAERNPFAMAPAARFDVLGVGSLILLLGSGALEHKGLTPLEEALRNTFRAVFMVGVYLGAARGCAMRKILGHPFVAVIGGMCYSVYLIHVPLMQASATYLFKHYSPSSQQEAVLIAWLVLLPISLLGGLLFYVVIERPCMAHDWPRRLVGSTRRAMQSVFAVGVSAGRR